MKKLKNQIFNVLKLVLIMHILISSGAALYGQITGSQIDPVKAIIKLQYNPRIPEMNHPKRMLNTRLGRNSNQLSMERLPGRSVTAIQRMGNRSDYT